MDNEEIFKQIENRNTNLKDNEYLMDRPTFDFLSAKFEEPTEDENPIIYTKQTDLSFLDKE